MQLHYIQNQIIQKLTFAPIASFSDLRPSDLESDKFNYHLQKLVKDNFITKIEGKYALSDHGKVYSSKIDFENEVLQVEKQPKLSVLVICTREIDGKQEFLIQTRIKQPFYGYMGFATGKLKFSEPVELAGARELLEETGITAKCKLKNIFREYIYNPDKKLVEDKLFFIVHATSPTGQLIDTKEGKNTWVKESELKHVEKKFYDFFDLIKLVNEPVLTYQEKEYITEGF